MKDRRSIKEDEEVHIKIKINIEQTNLHSTTSHFISLISFLTLRHSFPPKPSTDFKI